MPAPCFGQRVGMVVNVGEGEFPKAGRQGIVAVVVGDAQRALEVDAEDSVRVHLRESEN